MGVEGIEDMAGHQDDATEPAEVPSEAPVDTPVEEPAEAPVDTPVEEPASPPNPGGGNHEEE